jgi:hypothetical protein
LIWINEKNGDAQKPAINMMKKGKDGVVAFLFPPNRLLGRRFWQVNGAGEQY